MILGIGALLGVMLGWMRGGSFHNTRHLGRSLRYWQFAVAAIVVQVLIYTPLLGTTDLIHRIGPWIWVATLLVSLGVMLANLHLPWMWLIATGAALNLIVIAANGGFMPSPEDALRRAGRLEDVVQEERKRETGDYVLSNSTIADDDTRVRFLGDVLVIPKDYPLANVISVGDIVLAVGALLLMQRIMRMPPPPPDDIADDKTTDATTAAETSAPPPMQAT